MEVTKNHIWRKFGVIWLGVAVIVLVGGLVLRDYRNMKYDETLGINLVMVGDKKLAVVTLRREESMSSFVVLPEKMIAGDEDKNGRFRIGSLWKLGSLEKNAGGRVTKNLEGELGIKLPAFIKVGRDEELTVSGLLKAIVGVGSRTNLNWFDRLSIRSKVIELTDKGELVEETMPESLFSVQRDPDGVENLMIDGDKEKIWAAKIWVIPAVLAERINMAIFNNSNTAGKGRILARQMEIAGVKVVEIDKGGEIGQKCRYRPYRKDTPAAIKLVERTFGCENGGFEAAIGNGRVDFEVQTGGD